MAAGFRGLPEVSGVYLSKSTSRGFLGLLALQGVTVATAVKPRGFVGLVDFVGLPGFGFVPVSVPAGGEFTGKLNVIPSLLECSVGLISSLRATMSLKTGLDNSDSTVQAALDGDFEGTQDV